MTIASVERKLVKVDNFMDYCPGISIINNTINIAAKIVFCVLNSVFKMENIKKHHYFANLNDKSFGHCLLLLVPVIGNIIIKMIDSKDKAKLIKAIEENGVPAFQGASYKLRSDIDVVWAALKKDHAIFNECVDQEALKAKLFNHIARNGFSGFSSNIDASHSNFHAYCFFANDKKMKKVLDAKIFAYLKNSDDLDCFNSFFPSDVSSQQMIIDLREKVFANIKAGGQFDLSIPSTYRNDFEIMKEMIVQNPKLLTFVEDTMENREELYRVALNKSPHALMSIPKESHTLEMITDVLNEVPSWIEYARPDLITEDLAVSLLLKGNYHDNFKIIAHMPKTLQKNPKVLKVLADKGTWEKFQDVWKELQTPTMVEMVLSHSLDMLEHVQSELITKELVLSLLEEYRGYYEHVQYIQSYTSKELLKDPEVSAAFAQARRDYLDEKLQDNNVASI